jgi:hypothetical protein
LSPGRPPGDDGAMSERLEALRILSRYRRMVLLGRARLPLDAARRLVGPDCAYHLYFRHAASRPEPARRNRRSRG